jgi:hypothetical protein
MADLTPLLASALSDLFDTVRTKIADIDGIIDDLLSDGR